MLLFFLLLRRQRRLESKVSRTPTVCATHLLSSEEKGKKDPSASCRYCYIRERTAPSAITSTASATLNSGKCVTEDDGKQREKNTAICIEWMSQEFVRARVRVDASVFLRVFASERERDGHARWSIQFPARCKHSAYVTSIVVSFLICLGANVRMQPAVLYGANANNASGSPRYNRNRSIPTPRDD